MKTKMPEQAPEKRIRNFNEVNLGYSEEEAIKEATRCIECKKPKCVESCPIGIDIPNFIKFIKKGKYDNALKSIRKTNPFPGVCGRVCPQERQCQATCILSNKGEAIEIGHLERFAADNGNFENGNTEKNGKKAAVVGSGPAALSCAAVLANKGYGVAVFEALHKPGGVLRYGIPDFRLPKKVVEKEINQIITSGVEIKVDKVVGKLFAVDELLEQYEAVFIGSGAGLPYFLRIPGENLVGVYSANEFLTRINLMEAYRFPKSKTPIRKAKKTVVVGGGNVAMDVARAARRLGSDVTVIYRRSFNEMPARKEEIKHAKEEGIQFMLLTNPVKIIGDKKVEKIECVQMMLGEEDADGRRSTLPIEGSEFNIECDQVVIAIGQSPNPMLTKDTGIETDGKGNIVIGDDFRTSKEGIFAGGDIIKGEATVVKAICDGKSAANFIDKYIKEKESSNI